MLAVAIIAMVLVKLGLTLAQKQNQQFFYQYVDISQKWWKIIQDMDILTMEC